MKQPKKLKKQPNLKKRLDTVRTVPEPDVTFTVTLPADVYRALEVMANGDVAELVAEILVVHVEAYVDEPRDDTGV